ncbi:MAG: hypothetical protein HYY31_06750, partial [Chloroflexi bacterium]|nr:hypothetical protein [Chloroflexota bacterium]
MLSRDLRRLILIGVLVAVAAASIAVQRWDLGVGSFRFKRGSETFLGLQLGLDLQGGVHLVYEAQTENPTSEQMEGVLQTIERRVNAFGVAEPNIQTMGGNRLLVQLPGVANVEEAKRLIGETATLVFKERKCQDELCAKYEDKDIGLTGDDLARAYPGQEPDLNRPVVFLEFNSRGGKLFGEVTGRIAGTNNRVAIFLDT